MRGIDYKRTDLQEATHRFSTLLQELDTGMEYKHQ